MSSAPEAEIAGLVGAAVERSELVRVMGLWGKTEGGHGGLLGPMGFGVENGGPRGASRCSYLSRHVEGGNSPRARCFRGGVERVDLGVDRLQAYWAQGTRSEEEAEHSDGLGYCEVYWKLECLGVGGRLSSTAGTAATCATVD